MTFFSSFIFSGKNEGFVTTSKSTSRQRSRCVSIKFAYTQLFSLSVKALNSEPSESNVIAISL